METGEITADEMTAAVDWPFELATIVRVAPDAGVQCPSRSSIELPRAGLKLGEFQK